MKRVGFDHPKLGQLRRLLGLQQYAAVGIAESLWHFTAKHSPKGDVGKWPDVEIAAAIGWEHEPEALIEALVKVGLVDRDDACRLLIHDWDEHCDDSIHQKLARDVELFANGNRPKLTKLSKDERAQVLSLYERKLSPKKPSRALTKRASQGTPSLALPEPCQSLANSLPSAERRPRPYGEAFEKFWATYPKKVKKAEAYKRWTEALKRIATDRGVIATEAITVLLRSTEEFAASDTGRSEFCPDPTTWLHGGRYDDDRSAWARTVSNGRAVAITQLEDA